MSSRTRSGEEPGLFDDLPLRPDPSKPRSSSRPGRAPATPDVPPTARARPEPLPLFTPEAAGKADAQDAPAVDSATRPAWRPSVPFKAQLAAGLFDLGVMLGVGLLLWLGLQAMDVQIDGARLAILALFFLPFSFLYQVFPLAFWGRTPGMARIGLVARGRDGSSLTFSQAGLRWLASIVTTLLLGLPLLSIPITGRSLADRLSDSQTVPAK